MLRDGVFVVVDLKTADELPLALHEFLELLKLDYEGLTEESRVSLSAEEMRGMQERVRNIFLGSLAASILKTVIQRSQFDSQVVAIDERVFLLEEPTFSEIDELPMPTLAAALALPRRINFAELRSVYPTSALHYVRSHWPVKGGKNFIAISFFTFANETYCTIQREFNGQRTLTINALQRIHHSIDMSVLEEPCIVLR